MTKHLHAYILSLGALALLLTAVFIGSSGDAGAAPDLVTNGNFDANASGWTAAANSSAVQIPSEDGDLNPSSGALTVRRSSGGAGDGIASQCIDISASGAGNYAVSGLYKQAPGGSAGQTASIDVTVYTDNACSAGAAAHPSGSLGANSGWLPFSGTINFITTQQSMKIELVVQAVAQNDGVYFDKITLSNGPLDAPTATQTATPTSTNTPTSTPTSTSTPTLTSTPTSTSTSTPTNTPGPATNTPTSTNTPGPATNTPTATNTSVAATNTPTATNTVGVPTNTPTNTAVPTNTKTPTRTPTDTPTATLTPPPTSTNTAVPAPTDTPAAGPPPESGGEAVDDGGAAGAPAGEVTNDDSLESLARQGLAGNEAGAGVAPAEGEAGAEGFPDSGYGPQEHPGNRADVVALAAFIVAAAMLGTGFMLQARARRLDE